MKPLQCFCPTTVPVLLQHCYSVIALLSQCVILDQLCTGVAIAPLKQYYSAIVQLHQHCTGVSQGGISGFSVCIESVSWLFQLASLSFSKGMPSCEAYWKLWTFSACKSNFQQSATPTFYHRNSLSDMKQQDDTCTTKRC